MTPEKIEKLTIQICEILDRDNDNDLVWNIHSTKGRIDALVALILQYEEEAFDRGKEEKVEVAVKSLIEEAEKRGVEKEREECAKIASNFDPFGRDVNLNKSSGGNIAEAIRKRGVG